MSADLLREAATKMRERAEAAPKPGGRGPVRGRWSRLFDRYRRTHNGHDRALADYCSTWHPDVALAVADLLSMARDHAAGHGHLVCPSCVDQAVTVAHIYLGRDA